jgi:ABC-2 type transport system permease protein
MNFNRIKAIIIRHLYNFKHNPNRIVDGFYWPVIDLALWGLTSQYIQKASPGVSNVVLIVLSGLVFWQVVWRGQYEIAVNFLEEIWNHNLSNLFASPLTINEWVVGVFLLGFTKMFFGLGFAALVTWFLYQINVFQSGLMLIPFLANLLIMGWWVGLLVTSLLVRFGHQIETIAWAGVYILAPFCAIYYPLAALPLWAQTISRLVPASYVFEGMREIIAGEPMPWLNLALAWGLNLIYLFLSFLIFKACFNQSRKLGLARLD